jgi:decaprenylphospho-beta-D-ribofuranose 2-oxidase
VRVRVPFTAPPGLLNPLSMAAFNELWFRRARPRAGACQGIASYFHPLDAIGDWNKMYGPRGFLQYQLLVPFGAEDALRQVVTTLSAGRVTSFLAVLKRFGPADPGPLSFPAPGWTLALDLPAGQRGLGALLDGLDDVVAAAGGRVYLAKDARLRPELLETMYPRLAEWHAVCRRVDPAGILVSDLARRVGLAELGRLGAALHAPTRSRAPRRASTAGGRAPKTGDAASPRPGAAQGGATP